MGRDSAMCSVSSVLATALLLGLVHSSSADYGQASGGFVVPFQYLSGSGLDAVEMCTNSDEIAIAWPDSRRRASSRATRMRQAATSPMATTPMRPAPRCMKERPQVIRHCRSRLLQAPARRSRSQLLALPLPPTSVGTATQVAAPSMASAPRPLARLGLQHRTSQAGQQVNRGLSLERPRGPVTT